MTKSETTKKHMDESPEKLTASVVTVSDSKFELWGKDRDQAMKEDTSGKTILDALQEAGHEIVSYTIVPDIYDLIVEAIEDILEDTRPDIIITTGGTGISSRDTTVEALESILEKTLPGFGEYFRKLSFEEIGSAAILTRATAGVAEGSVIFALPGSPNACSTGMGIIIKEAPHLVKHAKE